MISREILGLVPTYVAATPFHLNALHSSSVRANNGEITNKIDEHSLIDIANGRT